MEKNKQIDSTDLDKLKELIHELTDKYNNITVNIEHVHIILSSLNELPLNFNFEKVDVKENSGNLNFGNTITGQSDKKKSKEKQYKQEDNREIINKDIEQEDIVVKVNDKVVGHQF